ncbi:hypothetical protein L7F22_061889 [Adiantum nelumboides]|nr:hypothetical protein [Adiantum nelumboides]
MKKEFKLVKGFNSSFCNKETKSKDFECAAVEKKCSCKVKNRKNKYGKKYKVSCRTCKLSKEEQKKVCCYICQKEGHIALECPKCKKRFGNAVLSEKYEYEVVYCNRFEKHDIPIFEYMQYDSEEDETSDFASSESPTEAVSTFFDDTSSVMFNMVRKPYAFPKKAKVRAESSSSSAATTSGSEESEPSWMKKRRPLTLNLSKKEQRDYKPLPLFSNMVEQVEEIPLFSNMIKLACSILPPLRIPTDKPLAVYSDASEEAWGRILCEIDNDEKIICRWASEQFSDNETRRIDAMVTAKQSATPLTSAAPPPTASQQLVPLNYNTSASSSILPHDLEDAFDPSLQWGNLAKNISAPHHRYTCGKMVCQISNPEDYLWQGFMDDVSMPYDQQMADELDFNLANAFPELDSISSSEPKVINEDDEGRRLNPVKMETDNVKVEEPSTSASTSSTSLKGVSKIGDMTMIDIDGLKQEQVWKVFKFIYNSVHYGVRYKESTQREAVIMITAGFQDKFKVDGLLFFIHEGSDSSDPEVVAGEEEEDSALTLAFLGYAYGFQTILNMTDEVSSGEG